MASGVKASCTLVASVLAASTTAAFTSAPADRSSSFCSRPNGGCSSYSSNERKLVVGSSSLSSEEDKLFAPRFDGLRFIETLVTAHR
ncbi:uncharacterized protein LOC108960164 [Eucalyptus grandis]|uniref:uncharacterized protein LOC108960164 n=1 Tax=Eucalyptus grandis TaxID=71139 RepID=UPI0008A0AA93|nr:uncharacterized protein LOC108960164 [Eucalyptus grandis]